MLSSKIAALFSPGQSHGSKTKLEWSVISRRGKPLLLLPRTFRGAKVGLKLYPAQRAAAKFAAKLLPLLVGSPLRGALGRLQLSVDISSELLGLVNSGYPAQSDALATPAILLGNQPEADQRFVLLGFDASFQARVVVKAGLSPSARESIRHEAGILQGLPDRLLGMPGRPNVCETSDFSAFSLGYQPGRSPSDASGLASTLSAWLLDAPTVLCRALPTWRRLHHCCQGRSDYERLYSLITNLSVRPVIFHGDFAPWNIKVSDSGQWVVLDWERAELTGIPGWDWFHFEIQTAILKHRLKLERSVARIENFLKTEAFLQYAANSGIQNYVKPLLLSYLMFQNQVVKPSEGREASSQLEAMLKARWQ